jgi:transposase
VEISRVAKANKLHPQTLEKQYKEVLSDFREWEQEVDADALVYPDNFGEWMSIDETALYNGELYTILTNKDRHGKKGALAALIKGTKNEVVSKALSKVPLSKRMGVKEITADLAESMDWICRTNFMNARLTADRFHVQQVVSEAVQEIRIRLRREAIDEENALCMEAQREKISFHAKVFSNGDTKKQLLARGRYLLFKPSNRWSSGQKERADILFSEYPEIKKAYDFSMYFRSIFENAKTREDAEKRLVEWMNKVRASEIPTLVSAGNTVNNNLGKILNYFPDGSTNASAESFNAKLKGFRSMVRGIRDIKFFLFRISTFFA